MAKRMTGNSAAKKADTRFYRTYVELYTDSSDDDFDGYKSKPGYLAHFTPGTYDTPVVSHSDNGSDSSVTSDRDDVSGSTVTSYGTDVSSLESFANSPKVRGSGVSIPCPKCGTSVSRSYLARHQKTKKCSNAGASVRDEDTANGPSVSSRYTTKIACERCGQNVSVPNLRRHQKSKRCMSATNRNEPSVSNVATVTQPSTANQTTCQKCGKQVTVSNLARHQKSKRCMAYEIGSWNEKLKRLDITPAPESRMCWTCQEPVMVSQLKRHERSERHVRLAMPSTSAGSGEPSTSGENEVREPTVKEEIKQTLMEKIPVDDKTTKTCKVCKMEVKNIDWPKHSKHTLKRKAEPAKLDTNSLVQRYPKVPKKSATTLKPSMGNVAVESMIRKPTRPKRPDRLDFSLIAVPPPPLISPLPKTPEPTDQNMEISLAEILKHGDAVTDEDFAKAMEDFDLELFDRAPSTKGPNMESNELNIPNSPVYRSPPHCPESPSYDVQSPTPPTADEIDEPTRETSVTVENENQTSCPDCGSLVTKSHLARHKKSKRCINQNPDKGEKQNLKEEKISCSNCGVLVNKTHLARHMKTKKCVNFQKVQTVNIEELDDEELDEKQDDVMPSSTNHRKLNRDDKPDDDSTGPTQMVVARDTNDEDEVFEVKEKATAFKSRLRTFVLENRSFIKDPKLFLNKCSPLVVEKIQDCVDKSNLKVNLVFHVEFQRTYHEKEIVQLMNFKTANQIIYPTTDVTEYCNKATAKILAEIEDFEATGSGWTLRKIVDLEIRVNKYTPLKGSSYICLPTKIQAKKAVINVQNDDQKCFLWSILSALHPAKDHVTRVSMYKNYEHEFDSVFKDIAFPVKLDDISKFEKRTNISINVYTLTGNQTVVPLRITDQEMERHIDLLYLKSEDTDHYCYIKNLSRLVSSQISLYRHRMWLCKRCLLHFGSEERLAKHREDCSQHDSVKITLPQPGTCIKFNDFNRSMRVPFVIYADFECLLESNRSHTSEHTQSYQKHVAMSFAYYIVSKDGDYKSPVTYFGADAGKVFVEQLEIESEKIQSLYSRESIKPMELTPDDECIIAISTTCHICEKPLEDDRVLDHDHLTGQFRGVAHRQCNILYRKPKFIPVFIHNLSGYDTHLFIKMLGLNNEEIQVIPNNEERYISYTVKKENMIELRFLDSFKFMSSGLDALTKNLSRDQFTHTPKYFTGPGLDLVLRKGIYPYDHMDSDEKYQLTHLPTYEDFYNKLNKTNVSLEDYEHAKRVWEFFQINDMKEYTLLYNKSDVLLLADVMENFRNVCMSTYKLDPAWFYTTPGLAWSAMLKTTQIELELIK